MKKKVIVEGGGNNIYEVSENSGIYYAKKVNVGFVLDDRVDIGKGRSLSDALAIISAHSGRRIKEVR